MTAKAVNIDAASLPEFHQSAVQRWHVGAEVSYRFADDEVHLWIAGRTNDGLFRLTPVEFIWQQVPEGIDASEPSMRLATDLGERVLEALVPRYVGTDVTNVVTKIRELERQRDKAQSQLDNLIAGFGRLGAGSRG